MRVRRQEAVELSFRHIQQREERWAIVDLKGMAGHFRTIPVPTSVKNVLDPWLRAANLTSGKLFRRVHKMGKTWGERLTEKAVWHVVREYAAKAGSDKLQAADQGPPPAISLSLYVPALAARRASACSDRQTQTQHREQRAKASSQSSQRQNTAR